MRLHRRVNNTTLEKLSGGEELHFRMLYARPRAFRPAFKLHLLCDPAHPAASSPGPRVHYAARFTAQSEEVDPERHVFPQDPHLDEWLRRPAVRMELLRVLIDRAA